MLLLEFLNKETYESLKDFDLWLETVPVLDLWPSDCLDSSFLSIFAMNSSTNLTIGAFAERL